jgi:DNA primase
LVAAAVPVVDYYFEVTLQDLDLASAKGKSEAVRRLAPILSEIRDEVERTHYIQKLGRLVRVDEGILRRQLGLEARRRQRRAAPRSQREPVEQAELPARPTAEPTFALEEHCLATLLRRPDFLEQTDALLSDLALLPLQEDDFERAENRALFAAWIESGEQDWHAWADGLSPVLQLHLDFLLERALNTDAIEGSETQRDIERQILTLRLRNVERTFRHVRTLQAEAHEQGDAKAAEYIDTMNTLTLERRRLDLALGKRTASGKRLERDQVA